MRFFIEMQNETEKKIIWWLAPCLLTGMALCEVALSDGSDLLAEEMKIRMEFYIHYSD